MGIQDSWKGYPQPARFVLVGILGVVIGWFVYNLLLVLNPIEQYKATTTWVLAYIFGIWQQHGLHRALTFENTVVPYERSLKRSFLAYLVGFLISTPINFTLVEILGFGIQISWGASVLASTLVNYYFLKIFAFEI